MFALLTMLSGSKTRSSERARSCVGQRRQSLYSRRPRVEALEDRRLMSVNVMTKFDGMRYDDFAPSTPSITYPTANPSLAAGPKYLVETVNAAIAFINKSTGQKIYEKSIHDFFASLNPHAPDFIYNPTVTYDEPLGRFVAVVMDNPDSGTAPVYGSYLDVAVSKTSDPGFGPTGWTFTQLDVAQGSIAKGGVPKIGWNYDSLVVSLGMNNGTNTVVAFDSSTLKNTNPATWKYYLDVRQDPSQLVPATMHGSVHGQPMWFAESQPASNAFGPGFDEMAVDMINVLSSNPSFTSSELMPTWQQAPAIDAPQPGSSQTIWVASPIQNVSWRNNRLVTAWTCVPTEVGAVIGVDDVWWVESYTGATFNGHLYRFATGEVSTPADKNAKIYRYDPAIEIDPHMNLGLTLVQSSPTQYMSMYVTGISAAQVASGGIILMDPPVGTHFGQTPRVSGGMAIFPEVYAGMCVDPVTGMFWAGNEYMPGGGKTSQSWGTGIANFSIT
jgi:hypothetical protein